MSHDQNFKNLILDYPRQALAFFATAEAEALHDGARIIPVRQEQLKERLGERFRELDTLWFEDYLDSDNLVARLNLPNMRYPPERRVEVYAHAVRGLSTLEPDRDRQLKYLEFVDIYAQLDDDELRRYRHEYPEETAIMNTFAERFIEQGKQQGLQQGMQQGMQQGEARLLIRLLTRKFGELPETTRQRIESADADTLLEWSERVLSASSLEDVLD